jgi:hypothetical protein
VTVRGEAPVFDALATVAVTITALTMTALVVAALAVAALAIATLAIATHAPRAHAQPPPFVIDADADAAGRARSTLRAGGAEILELAPTTSVAAEVEIVLDRARAAYVAGALQDCVSTLEPVAIARLFAERRAELVSRVLVWRTACAIALGDEEGARAAAQRFAIYGLDRPEDLGVVSPEVERVFREESDRVSSRRQTTVLRVVANEPAGVSVDNRTDACTTPCAVELPLGVHVVVVERDGSEPRAHTVEVGPEGATLDVGSGRATPEAAATQWTRRFRGSGREHSAGSIGLLGRALTTESFVLLTIRPRTLNVFARATVVRNQTVHASIERSARTVEAAVGAVLDAVRNTDRAATSDGAGPWPWVGLVSGLVAVGAGVALVLLLTRGERQVVEF